MASNTLAKAGDTVYLALQLLNQGAPITGQHPTVEIRRLRDGRYLNWAATVAPWWITVGGQKERLLVEKSWLPGLYQIPWEQNGYDSGPEKYLIVYRNVSVDWPVEEIEYLTFTFEWAPDVTLIRKLLANKSVLKILSETAATHQWYEDDGVTPLIKHDITILGDEETREPE